MFWQEWRPDMPMLDLSQLGLPTMPNGMLSSPTGVFPPTEQEIAEQKRRAAAIAGASAPEFAGMDLSPSPAYQAPTFQAPPVNTIGMTGGASPFGSLAPSMDATPAAPAAPTLPPWLSEMASAGPSRAGPPVQPMAPPVDPAALPPNAAPTSGMAPPMDIRPQVPLPDNVGPRVPLNAPQVQPAAPDAAPPAAPGVSLLDRLSAASHNLGARPGLPGIFDAISGAQTGTRMDPVGRQLQAENQTVQALIKKGIEPDMASAISKNPTLLQQIVPQLFGPKKYEHVMMKDAFGNEIPLSYDSST